MHAARLEAASEPTSVAKHADTWNIPGRDIQDAVDRSATLDRYCAEIGRAPTAIARPTYPPACYDQPAGTQAAIAEAIDAGFSHIVLGLLAPYPAGVAQWVAEALVEPCQERPSTNVHEPQKGEYGDESAQLA